MLSDYQDTNLYPYRYYDINPVTGSVLDTGSITFSFTHRVYPGWTSPRINRIDRIRAYFLDSKGDVLDDDYDTSGYISSSISGASGRVTLDLAKCTNLYKNTAASVAVLVDTDTGAENANGIGIGGNPPVANSSLQIPTFTLIHYTDCGKPTSPKVAATVSREAVELSWGAGSAGTSNSVTGYDVQYQDSADGATWPSSVTATAGWTTASGSPVTNVKLSVSPPATVGYYRRFRVRTRGSAGSDYYSDWVVSTNTLRRKWAPFGSYTDATLTAKSANIRAVHFTELQERVNVIRPYYGLSAYSFTTITAGVTKISKWATLVQEIRTAIDGITTNHESWNTLEAGKPRIAHITQLRNIIDKL